MRNDITLINDAEAAELEAAFAKIADIFGRAWEFDVGKVKIIFNDELVQSVVWTKES